VSRVLGVLLALVAVPISLGLATTAAIWLDSGSASAGSTAMVAVGSAPRVSIGGLGAGSLTVRPGAEGVIVVQSRSTVRGLLRADVNRALGRLRPVIRGAGTDSVAIGLNDIGVGAGLQFAGPLSDSVDLTVTVPPAAAISVSGGHVLYLEGLRGPVQVVATIAFVHLGHLEVGGRSSIFVSGGGVDGSVQMAGGSLDVTTETGGIRLQVLSPGGTRLHALTSTGSLELPSSYGLTRLRQASGYAVDGVVAGQGPGGQLTLTADRGVIALI